MGRAAIALVALAVGAAGCGRDDSSVAAPERPSLVETTTTRAPTTTEAPTTTTAPPTTITAARETTDVFALRPPAAAGDPRGLVRQITEAEATIRDDTSAEVDVARAALAQQVAYRQLGFHPEWQDRVLAALPQDLRRVAELHAGARREFRGMHSRLSTTLPAWRIVRPEPVDVLLKAYKDAEAEFGIPWKYLAAINLVETGLGRIRGTSIAGAQGPMQFMPATWEAYGDGGDINDTHDAIRAAARYLAANNGRTDIAHALFRYNHSQRYVIGVRIYADLIVQHPRAFLGFYHWGIWYLTESGDVYLPVGYEQHEPIPVAAYKPQ